MKPGPKPKSPDGHPKARYHTRMATDLIAFLRTLPNAAEWLDGVIRDGVARPARPLTYLACPYSDPDPAVRIERFLAANTAAGAMMAAGEIVFSPISHTHPVAVQCELPKGWEYWSSFDRAFIACSARVVVLMLEGWQTSVGVTAEIAIALRMGIPVEYREP